jgi:hypothetical protein
MKCLKCSLILRWYCYILDECTYLQWINDVSSTFYMFSMFGRCNFVILTNVVLGLEEQQQHLASNGGLFMLGCQLFQYFHIIWCTVVLNHCRYFYYQLLRLYVKCSVNVWKQANVYSSNFGLIKTLWSGQELQFL